MILLVGLGNPGVKYSQNRHNIGFMVIDKLVDKLKATNISKSQFRGELYKTPDFLLLKPHTFMNLSGESVASVKNYFKAEDIVVFHDELDIPLGSIRIKRGGSSGGHNGIKSIDAHIGNEYERVRLGIGRPKDRGEVINYVLSDFYRSQQECLQKVLDRACDIAIVLKELENREIIQKYSLKKPICTEDELKDD